MSRIEENSAQNESREQFAEQLAVSAATELVAMGFFDITQNRFFDFWAGFGFGHPPHAVAKQGASDARDDIKQILKDERKVMLNEQSRSGGKRDAFQAVGIRSSGYLVRVGSPNGDLYPVIAFRLGAAYDEAMQLNFLQIGLAYVTQQLTQTNVRELQSRNQVIETALSALSVHLAVVDGYGEIDYAVDLTPEWLKEHGGFEISGRRLCASTQRLQKVFFKALGLATGPDRQPSIVPIDTEKGEIKGLTRIAVIMPIQDSSPPRALVFLEQGGSDPTLYDHLLKLSGLTNSECRIARHLLQGKSLNEISDETNLSLSTVRSYMNGIFAKTNTHRQGQFITFFHNSVPRVKYEPRGPENEKP